MAVGSMLAFRVAVLAVLAAADAGADHGQLSLVLPPLLEAVVGLAVPAAATSRRVRRACPASSRWTRCGPARASRRCWEP